MLREQPSPRMIITPRQRCITSAPAPWATLCFVGRWFGVGRSLFTADISA